MATSPQRHDMGGLNIQPQRLYAKDIVRCIDQLQNQVQHAALVKVFMRMDCTGL